MTNTGDIGFGVTVDRRAVKRKEREMRNGNTIVVVLAAVALAACSGG